MKKLLLTLTLLLTLGFAASAEQVLEFSFANMADWDGLSESASTSETTITNQGYEFKINNARFINYSNQPALYMTKGSGYIILPAFDVPVVKLEIAGNPGTATNSVLVVSGNDITTVTTDKIKGTTVTVNINSTQAGVQYKIAPNSNDNSSIAGIKVYLAGFPTECAAPIFNHNNGNVYAGDKVSVSCPTNGATILWSVSKDNNSEEDINGYEYEITEAPGTTLTFTAIASIMGADNAEITSDIATLELVVAEKPFEPITVEEWQLVTDASTLAAGDMLIFVASYNNNIYAMSTESNSNNRKTITTVSVANNILTYDANETHKPLIVKLGGKSGAWTYTTTNYEGTNGNFNSNASAARLLIQSNSTATGNITINNNAVATVTVGDVTRNVIYLNYNGGTPMFSCYNPSNTNSSYALVQIYKLVKKEVYPEVANFAHNGVTVKGVSATLDYELHVANHAPGAKYNVTLTFTPETGDVVTASNDTHTIVVEEAPVAAPAREAAVTKLSGNVSTNKLAPKTTYAVTAAITVNGKTEESKIEDLGNITSRTTGIEDVTVDGNEAAEYFNLQGIRVAEPQAGQVYIVRRGAKTTKELVK